MTYDELEALVLDRKGSWALARALAPLDEKARSKLSGSAQKLYRQLYTGKAADSASLRLKAVLFTRQGDSWSHWNAIQNRHAMLALFALCPVSVVKKREIHVWHDQVPIFDQIIRDRRPAWLDDWIAHQLEVDFTHLSFGLLLAWIRDGVCAKPVVDGYYSRFASHLMRTSFYNKDEVVPPITAQLLADPELLADVEGLFRVKNIAFNTNTWLQQSAAPEYETWTEALLKLSADGHLDRAALLQWALDGLKFDFKQNQLSGFCGFYRRMAPSETELRRHQPGYIDLLCHSVGHVVKFAIEMLGQLEKIDALNVEPVLRELPVVFSSDGKGNALAALKLLKRIMARQKQFGPEALKSVGEALRHARPDVQSLALDISIANRAQLTQEDLEALRDIEPFVAASNRARFAQLISPDTDPSGAIAAARVPSSLSPEPERLLDYSPIASDRIEAPILRPEDEIRPIETVEALIAAVLHAVEAVESPDEIERIVDAISRLAASRPADFKARVAPLLHRLSTGGGLNSIVVAKVGVGVGVGGALLDLLYTWLTGRLHRSPNEETQYYTLEDGFVPVRQHLRAIVDRIYRGEMRALLSVPTHKGGWIDPLVWIQRLTKLPDSAAVDSMDFRLSMLRLAPDRRGEALDAAGALPAPLRQIVDFALGGDARPTRSDQARYAAWVTAARCRDPYADWSAELAPLRLDGQLSDAIRPARYIWRSSHRAHQHDRTRLKFPEFAVSVTCDGLEDAAASDSASGFIGRVASALRGRTAMDWRSLPTAALNRRMDRKRSWSGELLSPWVSQWLSFIWPQNPAAAYMLGVTRLMLRTDENSSSWSPSHGYFQPLFQRGRPWREPGHLLLCIGLVAKDADARGLAIDALIEGVDKRLFDPQLFAVTIARLAEGEWVKLNRVADGLKPVVEASTLHASVVSEALQHWLPQLDLHQKNAFQILEVLVEAQAMTGRPLDDAARSALCRATGNGKAARLAKQLIQ